MTVRHRRLRGWAEGSLTHLETSALPNHYARMTASYDDNTAFAEDEKGEPICYDWLRDRDGEAPPVRVQVKQAYVEKEWRLLGKRKPP